MATDQLSSVVRHLRRAASLRDGGDLTDGQLLECFIARREEAALEVLVKRHGPMVLGVCRRVLNNPHDAQDAFQATFLVLVRKATSIRPREMVGNWLYGVAYRTALEARAATARRRAREKQVKEMPEPQAPAEDAWPELRLVLDQELSRLPDKYRVPIVLCDLEGKTHKEAARHLGWPPGTVSGRLARARALLAGRLARRGVAFSTGALAVALAANTALACVSPSLISSTVKAASLWAAGQAASAGVISAQVAALTEGVLKAMLLTRLKVMGVLAAAVCVAALGGGALAHRCLAGPPLDRQAVSPPGGDREPTDAQARAPAEPAEEGTTVTGTLQAVDTDKNSVTVSTFSRKEGQSTETSFPVARDAAILRDGKEVKFSDLKKGGHVTLKLSPDPKTVVSLSVTGPTISAPLKSVDAEKNTLTITVENRQGKQDKTYQVAKDARVADEGKEAKLTDLKEGTTVILTLSVDDGNTIIHVRTPSRRGPGKNE